jgi:hypothetical protein
MMAAHSCDAGRPRECRIIGTITHLVRPSPIVKTAPSDTVTALTAVPRTVLRKIRHPAFQVVST